LNITMMKPFVHLSHQIALCALVPVAKSAQADTI